MHEIVIHEITGFCEITGCRLQGEIAGEIKANITGDITSKITGLQAISFYYNYK